jgi:hypothetical protein
LETIKENTMTIRIAIIAACAGTFALAQADFAQATYAAAPASKSVIGMNDVRSQPVIVVATLINISHSNIRHPGVKSKETKTAPALSKTQKKKAGAGKAMQPISDQVQGGSRKK